MPSIKELKAARGETSTSLLAVTIRIDLGIGMIKGDKSDQAL